MNLKSSLLVAGVSLALSSASYAQTPASPNQQTPAAPSQSAPKRDLNAEAMKGMGSSRSTVTPEQRAAMKAEKAAGKQPAAPGAPAKITAVQPGLLEVTEGRVNDAVGAGIRKITAKGTNDRRAVQIDSPWGHIYSGWPEGVKPVPFTIETAKNGTSARISAPGFTEANKAEYKAAIDAVVTMSISKASAQKAAKTKG